MAGIVNLSSNTFDETVAAGDRPVVVRGERGAGCFAARPWKSAQQLLPRVLLTVRHFRGG